MATKKQSTIKKASYLILALFVFVVIATFAGYLEPLYRQYFPNFSDRTLRNIESISNLVIILLAAILAMKTYKILLKR